MNEDNISGIDEETSQENESQNLSLSTTNRILNNVSDNPSIPESYYQFDKYADYIQRNIQRKLFSQANIEIPYFRMLDGLATSSTHISGKKYINFASYNYLNLCGHPLVNEAAKNAIDVYGTSVSSSRILAGERLIHQELEAEIADLFEVESCVVFVSGHATNVTTIGHLFGSKDLIIYDSLCHNSIVQGAILSGSKRLHFPHNDHRKLESILSRQRANFERVLIVTEGLFSMDGDIAPLKELIQIKKKYKTFLMVDEAHSIGVLGKKGKGIREHLSIVAKDVDIWMGTLSKALAGCGGFIAGEFALIENLRYSAPGFVFSVGLAPSVAAASLAALKILIKEPERVTRLQENSQLFLKLCLEKNLNIGKCEGYGIIPVIMNNSISVMKLANKLYEQGINAQPIIYPAVTKSSPRLRFFINCTHTSKDIHYTVEMLYKALNE